MADKDKSIVAELGSVPIGEMVRSMAMAVADAQFALDRSSLMVAEFMAGRHPLRDPATGALIDARGDAVDEPVMVDSRVQFGYAIVDGKRVPQSLSLMELGFVPNFYQFVDTVIEVKVALRLGKASPTSDAPETRPGWSPAGARDPRVVVNSTPIDAGYASSYNFDLQFASVFRTKLVPVPPPAVLEERLRRLLEDENALNAEEPES
ncbi:MAG: hypothetical protein KC486_35365 [Myxococcales bacterium]|nr:hypothetical protein [Myxococcales bacterium]